MKVKLSWLNWRELVIEDRELSPGAKGMAMYLHRFMNNKNDMAWPSLATIKGEMNYGSKTTVIKYLSELEKKGFLVKQKRFHNSNVYQCSVPEGIENKLSQSPEIGLSLEEVKVQNLYPKSPESGPGVVQNLDPNIQVNTQYNNQEGINAESWAEFEQHRKEIKQPLTNLARTKAQNLIKHLSPEDQAKVIDNTIQNRWRGLFPDKLNGSLNEKSARISESNHARVMRRLASDEKIY